MNSIASVSTVSPWRRNEFVPPHDIERALDDLLVDVRDIDGDESDGHEEDADEEHDEDGEVFGIGEGERPVPVEEIFAEENVSAGDEGKRSDEDTDVSGDLQREEGERDEAVQCELGEFPDAVTRGSVEPVIRLEGDGGAFESEPVDEAAGESLGLAETIEFIDDDSVEEPEVGRIRHDVGIGDLVECEVEEFSSQDLYPGIAPARFADTDDDFESLLPFPHEKRDEIDGMLEVGIEHHAGISTTEVDTGGRRYFFAEVSGKVDVFDASIEREDFLYLVIGIVLTSVIDEDEFVIVCILERHEHPLERVIERADVLLFIVGRDDEGNQFHGISVSWFFVFLKGCRAYEYSDERDGKGDEEEADGTDEEVFEEPGLVLGNTVIQFAEILPERIIAIDRTERE